VTCPRVELLSSVSLWVQNTGNEMPGEAQHA